jgi:poly-beta-1,6-N-acetyl-D-glucosamine synthase
MESGFDDLLWVTLGLILYTYVGYPLLLLVWSRLAPNPVMNAPFTPKVSVVIAAWNEKDRIAAKIKNCLQQDYPQDNLEIVVVSDGSTDGTDEVVRQVESNRVRLIVLQDRMGKAVALNEGVASTKGEVVLFADVRQRLALDVVARLVSHFADPTVGAVTGELVLESGQEVPFKEGLGLYWKVEKSIRSMEGAIDSVVGVTGAIYAIRKRLFIPLQPGTILDDVVVPMSVVMQGFRVTFDRQALAFDQLSNDHRDEFRRKVRTMAGNYQAFSMNPVWLDPRRNRLFVQVLSHKVFRLAVPFALLVLFLSSLALVTSG